MKTTKNSLDTAPGAAAYFSGTVHRDVVAAAEGPSRLVASHVHFAPGARTAWHTHPVGQTIYVTDGVGLAQARGGEAVLLHPGDRVFFEPGEQHWHGAAPDRFMSHLAMLDLDAEGNDADWGELVSDEEYRAAADSA